MYRTTVDRNRTEVLNQGEKAAERRPEKKQYKLDHMAYSGIGRPASRDMGFHRRMVPNEFVRIFPQCIMQC